MSIFYRTLYDFEAEDDGELSLKAGSIVREYPSGVETENEGWTFVQAADFSVGFVPTNYLERQEGRIRALDRAVPVTPSVASTMNLHSPDDEVDLDSEVPKSAYLKLDKLEIKANSNAVLPLSLPASAAVSTPTSSVACSTQNSSTMNSKLQSSIGLRAAIKKPQTSIKFVGETSKATGFVPAAEKEDLTELKKVTNDNFQRIITTENDNFEMLTDMVHSLSLQLNSYTDVSNGFLDKLSELNEFVEVEKRKQILKVYRYRCIFFVVTRQSLLKQSFYLERD